MSDTQITLFSLSAKEAMSEVVTAIQNNRILALLVLSPLLFTVFRFLRTYGQRGALYPPGPPTLPIIGNLNVFPRKFPQYKFGEWGEFQTLVWNRISLSICCFSARQYGDVISVKVMNQTIIVLHTPTLVKEIFDKRSVSNSNRPASTIVELITPNNMNLGTGHYGELNSQDLSDLHGA